MGGGQETSQRAASSCISLTSCVQKLQHLLTVNGVLFIFAALVNLFLDHLPGDDAVLLVRLFGLLVVFAFLFL